MDIKTAWKNKYVRWGVYAVGGIGAIFVLRSMLGGGSGGSSNSGRPSGPSDAQVAANAQIAAARIAASAQSQSLMAQLKAKLSDNATALAAARIDANSKITLQHESDQSQVALANISLQGVTAQLSAQTAQLKEQMDAQMHAIDAQVREQLGISEQQAGVANHQIGQSGKTAETGAIIGTVGMLAAAFF